MQRLVMPVTDAVSWTVLDELVTIEAVERWFADADDWFFDPEAGCR